MFSYADDRKKAAGRALGTLVEIITYYTLCAWDLSDHIVIERRISEFANPEITHNVEFSLHPVHSKHIVNMSPPSLPITPAKIRPHLPLLSGHDLKSNQVLNNNSIKRNAAVLLEKESGPVVANVETLEEAHCALSVCDLSADPFAIFECKRVGVEEGMKKGPQTIEKAKQGSYVARSVSSLQKIRLRDGQSHGFIEQAGGKFRIEPYFQLQREIIDTPSSSVYPGFMLTIGIVSNHGNWYSSENPNKELRVLAQSYDWLLFLTDQGLLKFTKDFLLNPPSDLKPVQEAFRKSYPRQRNVANRFTKVRIDVDADRVLRRYFSQYKTRINSWFNVISPSDGTLDSLNADLNTLANRIYSSG